MFGMVAVAMVAVNLLAQLPVVHEARAADPSASPAPSGSPPLFPALPSLTVSPDAQLSTDARLVPADLPPIHGVDGGGPWARSRALVAPLPESEWHTTALADALGDDPLAAFAWVRDSIGFDPYAGELRGVDGTVAARAGNSIDRTLLLKHLLDLMAVPNRLVRGTLSDTSAAALVARAFQPPTHPLGAVPLDELETGPFDSIVARARRDYALLRGALGDRVSTMDGSANADAIAATKDHFWVQMGFGAQWVDLDPSMADAQPGQTLTQPQEYLYDIPAELQQTVTIRVLAEIVSGGLLSESSVLDRQFIAADAGGDTLYLTFAPANAGTGATIAQALGSATAWQPVLYVGNDPTVGSAFPLTSGTDLFSGGAQNGPQISRLRLEVVVTTPGMAPITQDEVLVDRVPSQLRGSTTPIDPAQLAPLANVKGVPADFVGVYHIQVSTGGLDDRFHQILRGIAAQVTHTAVADPDAVAGFGFPFNALPATIDDEAMVVASEQFIRDGLNAEPGVHAYVSRPRVFVNAGGPTESGTDLWIRADLMVDEVSVVTDGTLDAAAAAARQIWYGALETALETQLTGLRAQKVFREPGVAVGASESMNEPLHVVDSSTAASLPSTASAALESDVRDGQIAVIPGDPATTRVWWTIDPATGTTRSIVDPGYGGQLNRGTPQIEPRSAAVGEGGPPTPDDELVVRSLDPEAPALTSEEMQRAGERIVQQAEARAEAKAAQVAKPRGPCGGEEATLQCLIIAGEVVFFAVLGLIVYYVV